MNNIKLSDKKVTFRRSRCCLMTQHRFVDGYVIELMDVEIDQKHCRKQSAITVRGCLHGGRKILILALGRS